MPISAFWAWDLVLKQHTNCNSCFIILDLNLTQEFLDFDALAKPLCVVGDRVRLAEARLIFSAGMHIVAHHYVGSARRP